MNLYLITQIAEIVKNNPNGFTVKYDFTESPDKGYAVAVKQTQNSFGTLGCLKAYTYALKHKLFFGGWFNEENKEFYFDAVKIFPEGKLKEAVAFAKKNNQIAIFDLGNNIEIKI